MKQLNRRPYRYSHYDTETGELCYLQYDAYYLGGAYKIRYSSGAVVKVGFRVVQDKFVKLVPHKPSVARL